MKTKFKLSVLIVILLVVMAGPSWAAKSVGYEEVACTAGAANTLTVATITSLKAKYADLWATAQVADYPVAYLTNGSTPTAATKKTAAVGDIIWLENLADLTNFQGIGVGGTSNLAVTYFTGSAK